MNKFKIVLDNYYFLNASFLNSFKCYSFLLYNCFHSCMSSVEDSERDGDSLSQ